MKISFVRSLMDFQERVLAQGTPNKQKYSFKELKELIFFNKILISNCNEMYEKYNMDPYMETYVKLLAVYENNIHQIKEFLDKLGVDINSDYDFEQRLLMATEIGDQIIRHRITLDSVPDYVFSTEGLHYITSLDDINLIVSYIDPKRVVYTKPLKYNGMYYPTIQSIMQYTDEIYDAQEKDPNNTFVVKLTKNGTKVTKVECWGYDHNAIKRITSKLWKDALVIMNPYIYIDDLEQIIDEHIDVFQKESQERSKITPLSMMDGDLLFEYPYQSFDNYLYFLKAALMDKDVKSIYIALYRIGKDPLIYYLLSDAVKRGIEVWVQLEMEARGDERLNRIWAKEFQRAGIHVLTYARGKLKVHSKITLVEYENDRSVAQIGTGNYHTKTATQYTDLNLITSDDSICKTIKTIFKGFISGNIKQSTNEDLIYMNSIRPTLYSLIDKEAVKGKNGFICIKCNSLDDDGVIEHLEEAAKVGCQIELIVRSVCTWIPEYQNVRVRSIVWDKLEHSRVWCFGRSNPTMYLGSLDLVTHKLDKRVETMVKVKSPQILRNMVDYINRYITSTEGSWILDGEKYVKEV